MTFFKFPLIFIALISTLSTEAISAYCYGSLPEEHAKAISAKDINDAIIYAYKHIGGDPSKIKGLVGKDKKGISVLAIDFATLDVSKTTQDYHVTLCYRTGNEVKYACDAGSSSEDLGKLYQTSLSGKVLSVNNYSDQFGDYFVLILNPARLEAMNDEGDAEPMSTKLHISILKVKVSRTFHEATQEVRDKIVSLQERFFKTLYGQLLRKQVVLKGVECEG